MVILNKKRLKITASDIKITLLEYWVGRRNYSGSCEVGGADVLIDNTRETVEIEIKIDKNDLRADKKKGKHHYFKIGNFKYKPNRFYYAVTANLKEEALLLINDINKNYGLITVNRSFNGFIEMNIIKTAKKISDNYSDVHLRMIARSLSFYRLHNMKKQN